MFDMFTNFPSPRVLAGFLFMIRRRCLVSLTNFVSAVYWNAVGHNRIDGYHSRGDTTVGGGCHPHHGVLLQGTGGWSVSGMRVNCVFRSAF